MRNQPCGWCARWLNPVPLLFEEQQWWLSEVHNLKYYYCKIIERFILVVWCHNVGNVVTLHIFIFLSSEEADRTKQTNLQSMEELVRCFMFTDNQYVLSEVWVDNQNMLSWVNLGEKFQFCGSEEPRCHNVLSIIEKVFPISEFYYFQTYIFELT